MGKQAAAHLCAAPHAAQAPGASPPHSAGAAARSGVHATSLLSAHLAGTTGFPKAATLSHRNIVNNSLFVGQGCKYSEADRWGEGWEEREGFLWGSRAELLGAVWTCRHSGPACGNAWVEAPGDRPAFRPLCFSALSPPASTPCTSLSVRCAAPVPCRVCIPVPLFHCFGSVMGSLAACAHGATAVYPAGAVWTAACVLLAASTHTGFPKICGSSMVSQQGSPACTLSPPHPLPTAETFDAAATLAAVQQERCTSLYGVPTMFVAALELPE